MVKRKKHKNAATNKWTKKAKKRGNKHIGDKVVMPFCGDVLT